MPSSIFVYDAGHGLSTAELTAACLDGHLVSLGESFIPADVVESPALRAASLAALLGTDLAATLRSAAWVYGGIDDPPARHDVQRAVERRLPHRIHRRYVYRDSALAPDDRLRLGGVAVTTPARTAADLARLPDDGGALASWAARDPAIIGQAEGWFRAHPGVPHSRGARRLLAEVRTT